MKQPRSPYSKEVSNIPCSFNTPLQAEIWAEVDRSIFPHRLSKKEGAGTRNRRGERRRRIEKGSGNGKRGQGALWTSIVLLFERGEQRRRKRRGEQIALYRLSQAHSAV
jgi:hypothetical protein